MLSLGLLLLAVGLQAWAAPPAPAPASPAPAPPASVPPAPQALPGQARAAWRFDLKNTTSGIVALESIVVAKNLVIFMDLTGNDPLQLDGASAWVALWNTATNTVRPLKVVTNTFCASGAMLSNGSMVSIGGDPGSNNNPNGDAAGRGLTGIRIFNPCTSADGKGCEFFEDPVNIHLAEKRCWLMSMLAAFYDIDPALTIEFFPPKDGGVPRPSAFLERSLPANLFPRIFALPDGRVLMIANNQTIIYDIETQEEIILPDIPNNVRVTNPIDGSAILLPLSPPNFTPEVLVCGGTAIDPSIQPINLSSQDPATTQCSRLEITPQGIRRGWQVEHMLEPRALMEMVHLPDGRVLITNGARTGYAALAGVKDPVGNSNADNPVLTPSLYDPTAPLGRRITNNGMPTTDIPRMYHSSVTLTPQGNFLIAGNNPNFNFTPPGTPGIKFPSELRVQTLDPPFMFVPRPSILSMPTKVAFNRRVTVPISVPNNLAGKVQLSLMDLGFSTHAFHVGARLVFMDATISPDRRSLSFTTPPNGRVYPPGPAWVFLTINGVSSEGVQVMVGSGRSPPTLE